LQIYPAIDLRNNQCVRLHQGQFNQVTTYSDNPIVVAKGYADQGAKWLHVVDLDAAEQNGHHHLAIIKQLAEQSQLNLQVGGGVRTSDDIKHLLKIGAKRIVIGSLAVKQPTQVKTWLKEFGTEQIAIAVDVFCDISADPKVAIHGWQEQTEITLWELLTQYENEGLKHVLCTDITRDGTLTGPHVVLYNQCIHKFPDYAFQASGGISQIEDLQHLHRNRLAGAIIGKALYEKCFTLQQVFEDEAFY
jgi:phosphoribosylformimino-5-aminoimidazole carboxamide ribotide isomerase